MKREVIKDPSFLQSGDLLISPGEDIHEWDDFALAMKGGDPKGVASFLAFRTKFVLLTGDRWPTGTKSFLRSVKDFYAAKEKEGHSPTKLRKRWILLRPKREPMRLTPNAHFRKPLPLP